jgi:lysophospholipase L1-like esterase
MFLGSFMVAPALVAFGWVAQLLGGASPPQPAVTAPAPATTTATSTASAAARTPAPWVAAWSTPAVRPGPAASAIPFDSGTGGRTVRDVVHTTLGGSSLRIRLSNVFGDRTAVFTDVRIALARGSGGVETVPGTSRRVRFGGSTTARVPAGRIVASDPVALPSRPGANLSISLYAPHATGIATNSGEVDHTSYVSLTGDATASTVPIRYPSEVNSWYWLAGVDVRPRNRRSGAIVALGDSITAGFDSTPDDDRDWPDRLAVRLRAAHTRPPLAVLNAGISGNEMVRSSPCFGQSGLTRLTRDALNQPGVRDVIVALGVNDITEPREPRSAGAYVCLGHQPVTATDLIGAYRAAIQRIHAQHLRAIGATITPFGRYHYWSPAIEAERRQVNRWIRTSHAFDAVIDFDRVLRDPAHPTWLRPAYDSGDGLHPNDAGHAAMAAAISPSLFHGP